MASNGCVKYAAASQMDSFDSAAEISDIPDKSRRSCAQKCALYSCLLGFVFILLGIACAFVIKPVVEKILLQRFPFYEGGPAFESWKEPPVTPVLFLRLFNLTNEKEFLSGAEKPRLKELGPYAYRQKLLKTHIEFRENETMHHKDKRLYYFAPDLSEGYSDSDVIVVPNLPLFGAMKKMASEPDFAKDVFKTILKSYEFANDTAPFLRLTVKEFLWGYPSLFISLQRCQESSSNGKEDWQEDFDDWGFESNGDRSNKKEKEEGVRHECDISPENLASFGLFLGRNDTSIDPRELKTGVSNLTEKGLMISWQGNRKLQFWSEDSNHCNDISSSWDPAVLPMDLQKTDVMPLFIGNMGRTIRFKYVHEVHIDQFRTYRFVPGENSFDSAVDNPDNGCYCIGGKNCLPSGLHDISTANPGSPVVLSWPHFLYADPDLKKAVTGMSPDSKKHTFFFDVEPKYGITMAALARLQMNVEVIKKSGFGYFDNIADDRVFLPFAWVEEGITGPSEVVAESVELLLKMPESLRNLLSLVAMVIGIVLLLPEIVFWIRSCFVRWRPNSVVLPKRLSLI